MTHHRNNTLGLTMIELVVAMVILVIVVAVVVPAFQTILRSTEDATVRTALAEIRSAVQAYSAREIAAGRATRGADGRAGGWPLTTQVDDTKYSSSGSLPKVLPNGDVPENPYAKHVFTKDFDHVIETRGPRGGGAVSWLLEKDVAYAKKIERLYGDSSGLESGGGKRIASSGWYYNPKTGEVWTTTNVNGENMY